MSGNTKKHSSAHIGHVSVKCQTHLLTVNELGYVKRHFVRGWHSGGYITPGCGSQQRPEVNKPGDKLERAPQEITSDKASWNCCFLHAGRRRRRNVMTVRCVRVSSANQFPLNNLHIDSSKLTNSFSKLEDFFFNVAIDYSSKCTEERFMETWLVSRFVWSTKIFSFK